MDYYLKSGAGAIPYANRTWTSGEKMVPAASDSSTNKGIAARWVWEVTTGGTSNATPAWPASVTQDTTTVTQNGVVWTARRPGYSSGTTRNWAFATIYLQYAAAAMAAGDRLFISHLHAESWPPAAEYISSFSNAAIDGACLVFVVNDGQTDPALMARATGASVSGSDTVHIQAHGLSVHDLTLKAAVGAVTNRDILIGGYLAGTLNLAAIRQVWERCILEIGNAVADGKMSFVNTDNFTPIRTVLNDCSLRFGGVGQLIECGGVVEIKGGGLHASSAAITHLFAAPESDGSYFTITGFDLSGAAQGLYLMEGPPKTVHIGSGRVVLRGCRMPAGWNGGLFQTSPAHETTLELYDCADSLGNKWRVWTHGLMGQARDEVAVYRIGGATDHGVPFSLKLSSSAYTVFPMRACETPELPRRFPGTAAEVAAWTAGASITVEVEVIHNAVGTGTGGRLTNADIWLSAEYLGTAGSPLAKHLTSAKGASSGNPFGDYFAAASDHADSSEHWVSTGIGSPMKQKLALTIAPEEKGYLQIRVHLAKASTVVYLCPRPKVR